MIELKNTSFNKKIAEDTSNILLPDAGAVANGIGFKSNINSNSLNGYFNLLSETVQYLQFTGGLYNKAADYHEGNIASLVIKKGNDYSIKHFKRNSNNSTVLNNNPPIKEAHILAVNGIDIYEGGALNDDWDSLSAEYSIEAIANTVIKRDNEGGGSVKMPADVGDDTVVNNKYLNEKIKTSEVEINKKIETSKTEINKELEKKQNKLTAGQYIEISEDNVISAAGDLSTKASSVTYDNSNTNLEYTQAVDNVQVLGEALNKKIVETNDKIIKSNEINYQGKSYYTGIIFTNEFGIKNIIYRKQILIPIGVIRDGIPHYLSFRYSDYGLVNNSYIITADVLIDDHENRCATMFGVGGGYLFVGFNNTAQVLFFDYQIPASFYVNISRLRFDIKYLK